MPPHAFSALLFHTMTAAAAVALASAAAGGWRAAFLASGVCFACAFAFLRLGAIRTPTDRDAVRRTGRRFGYAMALFVVSGLVTLFGAVASLTHRFGGLPRD